MDEKVVRYRKRHKRCKYCIHKTLRTPKCSGLPDYYVCEAKDKVMLNSIDKVKEFVNKTSRVDGDVFLQSGRYIIDAKSIMGIFSLDLTKPLSLSFEKCSDEEVQNYMSSIHEFIMEE